DRIKQGPFEDTNRMFVAPEQFDLRVTAEGTPEYWAEQVMTHLRPVFDPKKPTALFVGRYQPFHDGHKGLIVEASSVSARPASPSETPKAPMKKIRSSSNMCGRGSSTGCANTRAASS